MGADPALASILSTFLASLGESLAVDIMIVQKLQHCAAITQHWPAFTKHKVVQQEQKQLQQWGRLQQNSISHSSTRELADHGYVKPTKTEAAHYAGKALELAHRW